MAPFNTAASTSLMDQLNQAKNYLVGLLPSNVQPTVGIVCGSGLGKLYTVLEHPISVGYESIPGFVQSTVAGHEGKLVFGKLGSQYVVCMVGRFHPYEGYAMTQVTFPIRVLCLLGIKLLVVTNAAGGLNPNYKVGDMMVFEDHLALPVLAGNNPLVGANLEALGPRFPATSTAYPRTLRSLAFQTAQRLGLMHKVHSGIYCFVSGPQYESRAECRALRLLGGDAVGMSTVPEVLIAAHMGVPVLGVSLITNAVVSVREPCVKTEVLAAAGTEVAHQAAAADRDSDAVKANHEEVLQASKDFAADVQALIKSVLEQLNTLPSFQQ